MFRCYRWYLLPRRWLNGSSTDGIYMGAGGPRGGVPSTYIYYISTTVLPPTKAFPHIWLVQHNTTNKNVPWKYVIRLYIVHRFGIWLLHF